LGYTTVILLVAINGITLGTNSFSISMGGKMPPSFEILRSSGLYEMTAYVLASVATISISKYRLIGAWPKQKIEKIENHLSPTDLRERNIGIILSIIILTGC
jgi:uncharacterized membrane protein SpoIIM required for sporulation